MANLCYFIIRAGPWSIQNRCHQVIRQLIDIMRDVLTMVRLVNLVLVVSDHIGKVIAAQKAGVGTDVLVFLLCCVLVVDEWLVWSLLVWLNVHSHAARCFKRRKGPNLRQLSLHIFILHFLLKRWILQLFGRRPLGIFDFDNFLRRLLVDYIYLGLITLELEQRWHLNGHIVVIYRRGVFFRRWFWTPFCSMTLDGRQIRIQILVRKELLFDFSKVIRMVQHLMANLAIQIDFKGLLLETSLKTLVYGWCIFMVGLFLSGIQFVPH